MEDNYGVVAATLFNYENPSNLTEPQPMPGMRHPPPLANIGRVCSSETPHKSLPAPSTVKLARFTGHSCQKIKLYKPA
jgi:hypothetical protein